jgi:hypothetical protein
MLRKLSELGEEGAFGPEEVRILVAALDAAWEAVKASGGPFSEPEYEAIARDILAKGLAAMLRKFSELGASDLTDL